ncbi:MAG TPA: heavy metal-binding domain-containing protein, partial [Gemmatimonadales bacterium]|nr:heavy metal-binding domain-containing protein [Gemmatimonadales bacterium]
MTGHEHHGQNHHHHHHHHAAPAAERPVPAAPGGRWTCPMHPEVVSDRPGSCPICGMALEPVVPSAVEASNPELADMTRRFWVGVVLSLPLLLIAMLPMVTDVAHALESAKWRVVELALATPVVLWGGWPFFERGWRSIVTMRLNMFTLIAMGIGVAWGYSVVAVLAPGLFPPQFRQMG